MPGGRGRGTNTSPMVVLKRACVCVCVREIFIFERGFVYTVEHRRAKGNNV